jgi:hypothetical protein
VSWSGSVEAIEPAGTLALRARKAVKLFRFLR